MRPVEDCLLPLNVLAVNVPSSRVVGEDEIEDYLSDLLTETYGFCHDGFLIRGYKLDEPCKCQARLPEFAVMNAEQKDK